MFTLILFNTKPNQLAVINQSFRSLPNTGHHLQLNSTKIKQFYQRKLEGKDSNLKTATCFRREITHNSPRNLNGSVSASNITTKFLNNSELGTMSAKKYFANLFGEHDGNSKVSLISIQPDPVFTLNNETTSGQQQIKKVKRSNKDTVKSKKNKNKSLSHTEQLLKSIYSIVSSALDNANLKLRINYQLVTQEGGLAVWKCSFKVAWPQEAQFMALGGSKTEASEKASLSAYQWLTKLGKINKDGLPILVNKNTNFPSLNSPLYKCLNFKTPTRNFSTSARININNIPNTTAAIAKNVAAPVATVEAPIVSNLKSDVPFTSLEQNVLDKELECIHKLFPMPKSVLHNAFDNLVRELNDKTYKLKPIYVKIKEKNYLFSWCCTYHLKWPETMKFSITARTKQEASCKAALSALSWLKKHDKLSKEGHLILMGKTEVKEMIKSLAQPLNLDVYTMERIRDIIKRHETNFLPRLVVNVDDEENNNASQDEDSLSGGFEEDYLDNIKFKKGQKQKFINSNRYLAKEKVHLPIAPYKQEFLDMLENNPVVIVKGEPGCGKSTRVPQYVLESWIKGANPRDTSCRIAVTQPRRIAAISLAERVANERNETAGEIIGYQVRLKSNFRSHTGRVLYCTTGILLRHLQSDPTLANFSHVILDEAHERDVNTDLLMNLLKRTMKTNPNLKLIVMSATIDTDLFHNYFDKAPVIHIPGFTHPVVSHFLDECTKIDLSKTKKMCDSSIPAVVCEDVVKVINFIHSKKPEGAILCFLPGWEEIARVQKSIPRSTDMVVHCLHSRLQDDDQWRIFSRPPPGVRKIILATNIAETSVTIDDVVYVIDTGIHKEKRFDNEKGISCIDNYWVSKANMIQRRGRAGRVCPGESFHLYPRSKMEEFSEFADPEILRTSLTKIVLDAKAYSNNMDALEFMSQLPCPPEEAATLRAVQELKDLELLDETEKLTPLGKVLSDFQLEPKLAKALVNAVVYKCVTPIVDIVTLFSAETELFSTSLTDKETIKKTKVHFCANSDHLALMRLFEKWLEYYEDGYEREAERFCRDVNLIEHKLVTLQKLRKIHFDYLVNGLYDILPIGDVNSDNDELVKAVLLSAIGNLLLYKNWDIVKGKCKKANVFLTNNNHKATITSDSVNFKKTNFGSDYLMYINETRSNIRRTTIIRECSAISPLAVILFSSKKVDIKETGEDNKLILALKDSKIEFMCNRDQALEIVKCKEALQSAYQYYIYQMTRGGDFDEKLNEIWDKILHDLNLILTKHTV